MKRVRGLVAALGLAVVVIGGAACSLSEASPDPGSQPDGEGSPQASAQMEPGDMQQGAPAAPAPDEGDGAGTYQGSSADVDPAYRVQQYASASASASQAIGARPIPEQAMPYPQVQARQGASGIWVTGDASTMVSPDLAVLNLGVQVTADSVSDANNQAAEAMDAIMQALRGQGIAEADIQTTRFNISPQYEYAEVVEEGVRRGERQLVGYEVTNSVSAKIRNLDSVGNVIAAVVDAGGDATRVHHVDFTVEDTEAVMSDLREGAVREAMDKAQQFANLAGVQLGNLTYISENGGNYPILRRESVAYAAADGAAMAAPPPISAGEMEVSLSVQAAFGIN